MDRKRPPKWLTIHPEVEAAMVEDLPIVALESTVITHGLPRPINLETAMRMESEVRKGGAVPATIAVVGGRIHLGLDKDDLERLALSEQAHKVSLRDLGSIASRRADGGTTVAATIFVAQAAGLRVFATGGIGGVHRTDTADISADLPALARWPVAVVCSGAKAFLDLPRTLEWLETAGVPVIGFQTSEFPAFFSARSGLPLSESVGLAQEAVDLLKSHWELGLQCGAVICVPCPGKASIPWDQVQAILGGAEAEATASGVRGAALSPFILDRLATQTGGATLQANIALLRNNARVAAEIASLM